MTIKKEFIKREIAGDTILVPVGQTVYDSNGLYVMNALASFLWDRLPQAETEAELCAAVLEEYEVSQAEALADIGEFLTTLRGMGIL